MTAVGVSLRPCSPLSSYEPYTSLQAVAGHQARGSDYADESGYTAASDKLQVQGSPSLSTFFIRANELLAVQTELAPLGLASDVVHLEVGLRRSGHRSVVLKGRNYSIARGRQGSMTGVLAVNQDASHTTGHRSPRVTSSESSSNFPIHPQQIPRRHEPNGRLVRGHTLRRRCSREKLQQ